MSGDDFSTVNARGAKARDVEALRQRYRQQREELVRMVADIDRALAGLDDDLLSHPPAAPKSEAGMRPLVAPPQSAAAEASAVYDDETDRESRLRVVWIVVAALVALALIGWLIWKASSDRPPEGALVDTTVETTVDTTADTTTAAITTTIAEETPAARGVLSVTPEAADYGTIRKGTRATRQFEVSNDSEEPVSIALSRSACRCLYYEHTEVVPPKGKETITVTVDGAKATAGELRESVRVTVKRDPSIVTTFEVNATIR